MRELLEKGAAVEICRIDSSRRRGIKRVGLLMAAVVVEMERVERIMTVREVFGLSCRMNWRGWKRRRKTSLLSRKSGSSRRNASRKNDRSGRVRRKGGDESNSGDRGRPSRRV